MPDKFETWSKAEGETDNRAFRAHTDATGATYYTEEVTLADGGGRLLGHAELVPSLTPDLFPSLSLWLRASDLTLADGAAVATWTDRSGLAHDMTQATASAQPVFHTNVLNGKPVVRFSGAQALFNASAFLTGTSGIVWVVASVGSGFSNFPAFISSSDQLTDDVYFAGVFVYNDGRLFFEQANNDTPDVPAHSPAISLNTYYLFEVISYGAQYELGVDGVLSHSMLSGSDNGDWFGDTPNRDNVSIGAYVGLTNQNFLTGDIAEVIVFDGTTLEVAQRAAIRQYLADAYALPLSGPQILDSQDWLGMQATHQTLTASTDTAIVFAQPVRAVQVKNWDTANRVLVKDGTIATDVDSTASRVGIAPAANVNNSDWFPFSGTTIHLRSAGASEVTIEGYF